MVVVMHFLNNHFVWLWHMVTIFGGRGRQHPIDGMLILDLHNYSHHIQPHSIIFQYMKYF